jgi:hypothetical protein
MGLGIEIMVDKSGLVCQMVRQQHHDCGGSGGSGGGHTLGLWWL